GFNSSIATNGYLLCEEVVEKFFDAQIFTVNVTLDGSEEQHNRIRNQKNVSNTFQVIISNISNYLKYDNRNKVIIRFQLHDLHEAKLNSIISSLHPLMPLARQITVYFRPIFLSCADGLYKNIDNKESLFTALNFLYREIFALGFNPLMYSNITQFCNGEMDSYWLVNPRGELYKCSLTLDDDPLGCINENGEIRMTENFIKFYNKFDFTGFSECRYCANLPICWGGCMLKRNNHPVYGKNELECTQEAINDQNLPNIVFFERLLSIKKTYLNSLMLQEK
ncbi:MAG: SPASM domain-containing protein, partial [Candidatus Pacearchaeota archaeon]|nr:SPASM domain-containing protein [Candidatus Pacearchaeota archaeon]